MTNAPYIHTFPAADQQGWYGVFSMRLLPVSKYQFERFLVDIGNAADEPQRSPNPAPLVAWQEYFTARSKHRKMICRGSMRVVSTNRRATGTWE